MAKPRNTSSVSSTNRGAYLVAGVTTNACPVHATARALARQHDVGADSLVGHGHAPAVTSADE